MFHFLTLIKQPKSIPQIARAKRHGIVSPLLAYNAAKKQGIDFALACAILMRETSGGHNVFGHDPTICIGWGTVTKAKYLMYRERRNRTGSLQGIGPCQLTALGLQDEADRYGGCWKEFTNLNVGFHFMHDLIKTHHNSIRAGIEAYNGSGPAAVAYADAVMKSRSYWQNVLSGKKGNIQ